MLKKTIGWSAVALLLGMISLTQARTNDDLAPEGGSSCGGQIEATCPVSLNTTTAMELEPCFGKPIKIKEVAPGVKQAIYDARPIVFKHLNASSFDAQKMNMFMTPNQVAFLAELTTQSDGRDVLTNMAVVNLSEVTKTK